MFRSGQPVQWMVEETQDMSKTRDMQAKGQTNIVGLVAILLLIVVGTVAVLLVMRTDTTGSGGNRLGEQFQYDLSVVRKTDPKLVHYELAASFPTGMDAPRGIACDVQGRIHVGGGHQGKGAIRQFDPQGQELASFAASGPVFALTLADGTVFAALKDHVEVIGHDGKAKARWPVSAGSLFTSIAVGGERAFVADYAKRRVLRYDLSGKLLGVIEPKDADSTFAVPSPYFDLAVDAHDRLWVANPGKHRLEAYTLDGVKTLQWGKPSVEIDGFCGCCNPVNFALLPDGRFVTAEKGLPRVKVHTAEGQFESVVVGADAFPEDYACINRGPSDCQGGGMDVAVDNAGRILVLETHEKAVRVYVKKERQPAIGNRQQ